MTWSTEHIDVGVQASLFQIYPILLSTLLSINRQQLSLLDANFVFIVCSSPLMAYLGVASISDLFGIKTGLYKRIKYHRLTTRAFGALLPLFWLGLSMTLMLSHSAFIDSEKCEGSTLRDWFRYSSLFLRDNITNPGDFGFIFWIIFGILLMPILFRRWSEVVAEAQGCWEGQSNPRRWFYAPWTFVSCTWYVPSVLNPRPVNS